jgi:hypothetical protein|nr:MAG TPA: hypothetical protein [Caudoviricetes sp.]
MDLSAIVTSAISAISTIVIAIITHKTNNKIKSQNELLEESKRYSDEHDEQMLKDLDTFKKDLSIIKNSVEEYNTEMLAQICTNFIILVIGRIKQGHEIDDTTKKHFYKQYDIYTNQLKLNSYIHEAVANQLKVRELLLACFFIL